MNIFVAQLDYGVNDSELEALFTQFGEVSSAKVILDRETGRSRGFGFVEMDDEDEALDAIEGLNGTEHRGRTIKVNKARPREERGGGGFNRGGGGGFRGGRGDRGGRF